MMMLWVPTRDRALGEVALADMARGGDEEMDGTRAMKTIYEDEDDEDGDEDDLLRRMSSQK